MHDCPDCGQACTCNGDIDDCFMESGADDCSHFLKCQAPYADDDDEGGWASTTDKGESNAL